jgi:hypothetical protein
MYIYMYICMYIYIYTYINMYIYTVWLLDVSNEMLWIFCT